MKPLLFGFSICVLAVSVAACNGGGRALSSGGVLPAAGGLVERAGAVEKVLYTFKGSPDGQAPYAGLFAGKNGEFYGVTNGGGTVGPSGYDDGTVFEVSSTGKEKVIYMFQGGKDGAGSEAGVIADSAGDLFGATDYGGGAGACSTGCGTVYELTPKGGGYTERVLHAFKSGKDGALPIANLLLRPNGVLYGTTTTGGTGACSSPSGFKGCGTVFSMTPSGSTYVEKVIYAFKGGSDGEAPRSALIADQKGNLYGTTEFGGNTNSACDKDPSGNTNCGTVFKLTPAGKKTILYKFNGGTTDGANPRTALFAQSKGYFIGLTVFGGSVNGGVAYELIPKGTKYTDKLLWSFGASTGDGARPADSAGLSADTSGNLYGTLTAGGGSSCGCGAVFELSPSSSGYTEKVLHEFTAAPDGAIPFAGVTVSKNVVYGTTYQGGGTCASSSQSCGVVFDVKP